MPKRSSKSKDVNSRAFDIVKQATSEPSPEPTGADLVSKVMREMGRKGGLKGGKARADSMTPEKRREIAAKAAAARWRKKD